MSHAQRGPTTLASDYNPFTSNVRLNMASHEQIQHVINAWKEADKAASDAEKQVTEASFRYVQKTGPRPADDAIGDARMLRSLANERLQKALDMMNVAAQSEARKPKT